MKQFFVRHGWGMIFAIFVGLCIGLPSFLAPLALGDAYRGIQFLYLDDDVSYRARIHEILDGHYAVRSPNLFEYKDGKSVIPPINEYIYAIPALLFGLPFVVTASKFLFPGILFFLMYLLARRLMEDEPHSHTLLEVLPPISAAFAAMLITDPSGILRIINFLLGNDPSLHVFPWTRLVNPIVGGIFLFAFLLALHRLIREPSKRYMLIGAIILGASVGYFFSFGLGVCIAGILFLIYVFRGDKKRYFSLLGLFVATAIIGLPYFYVVMSNIGGGGEGEELAGRNGMFFTHEPVLNKVVLVTLAVTVVAFAVSYALQEWKKYETSWVFIFALVLGSLGAFNHQIITGRSIWHHHFTHYTVPLSLIVLMSVGAILLKQRAKKILLCFSGGIVVFSMAYFIASVASYRYVLDDFRIRQIRSDVIDYFNTSAHKDCVVYVNGFDDPLEVDIPAYTPCNVYNTVYIFTGVTTERILHNFLLKMRFDGVTEKNMREYLLAHVGQVRKYFFSNWDQDFGVGVDDWVLGRIAMIENAYRRFIAGDIKGQLLTYRMDYLISSEPLGNDLIRQLPGLRLSKTFTGYYLYVFDSGGNSD